MHSREVFKDLAVMPRVCQNMLIFILLSMAGAPFPEVSAAVDTQKTLEIDFDNLQNSTGSRSTINHLNDTSPLKQLVVKIDPARVQGQPDSFSAYPLTQYRLFSWRDGQLHQIPMQIEEKDARGWRYMKRSSRPLIGTQGIFDEQDQMLFMYSDLSENRWPDNERVLNSEEMLQIGLTDQRGLAKIIEIELDLEGETSKYGYLFIASSWQPANVDSYIDFSAKSRQVKTDLYQLTFLEKDPLRVHDFYFRSDENQDRPPVYDGYKIRIIGKIFGNVARFKMDNNSFHSRIVEVEEGPIRTSLLIESKFRFFLLPMMKVETQIHFYANAVKMDISAKLPQKIMKMFFWKPITRVSMDGNALYGASVRAIGLQGFHGVVDGKMTPHEMAYRERALQPGANWLSLSTKGGFQTLTRLISKDSDRLNISLFYEDDASKKDKPERFLGQLPNLGYQITDVEKLKEIDMSVEMYFNSQKVTQHSDPLAEAQNVTEYINALMRSPKLNFHKVDYKIRK